MLKKFWRLLEDEKERVLLIANVALVIVTAVQVFVSVLAHMDTLAIIKQNQEGLLIQNRAYLAINSIQLTETNLGQDKSEKILNYQVYNRGNTPAYKLNIGLELYQSDTLIGERKVKTYSVLAPGDFKNINDVISGSDIYKITKGNGGYLRIVTTYEDFMGKPHKHSIDSDLLPGPNGTVMTVLLTRSESED